VTNCRRSGFTLIELLISMTIIGILSAVAIPKFREVKRRATATQIVGDFDVVRVATMSFFVDSGYFPQETGSGQIPQNLNKYLPTNFKFAKSQWTLDYENWSSKKGAKYTKTGILVGVSVTTQDQNLGKTAAVMLGNSAQFTMGSKHTFMISGM
jgi:prepilin-type N-terminal cleavage/methylation domain-containing protein